MIKLIFKTLFDANENTTTTKGENYRTKHKKKWQTQEKSGTDTQESCSWQTKDSTRNRTIPLIVRRKEPIEFNTPYFFSTPVHAWSNFNADQFIHKQEEFNKVNKEFHCLI